MLDAHCPHNGAHLGVGGRVVGETLRCPFHAWEFDTRGRCAKVPGRDLPPRAGVGCWPARERNGAILAWFDEEKRPPSWEMDVWPERGSPRWTPFRRAGSWRIRVHVQDLVENAIDSAHFTHVHTHVMAETRSEGLETTGPTLVHRMHTRFAVFGLLKLLGPPPEGPLVTRLEGLGLVLIRTRIEGKKPISYTSGYFVTPIDEEHVEVSAVFAVERGMPRPIAWAIARKAIAESRVAMDQDIPIFEHKVYRERPLLQATDGPILRYRSWVQQFYPADRAASARPA